MDIHKTIKGTLLHLFLCKHIKCALFSKNKHGAYGQITVQDPLTVVEILQGVHQFFHHVVCRSQTQVNPLLQCVVTQLSGEVGSSIIGRLFYLK